MNGSGTRSWSCDVRAVYRVTVHDRVARGAVHREVDEVPLAVVRRVQHPERASDAGRDERRPRRREHADGGRGAFTASVGLGTSPSLGGGRQPRPGRVLIAEYRPAAQWHAESGKITDEGVARLRARIGIPEPHPMPPYYTLPTVDTFRNVAIAYGDDNPLWCDPEYGAEDPLGAARSRRRCSSAATR